MKVQEQERTHGTEQDGNPFIEHKHQGHDYWHPKARQHYIEATPAIKASWVAGENSQGSMMAEKIENGIRVHRHGTNYCYFHPVTTIHPCNYIPSWKLKRMDL